MLREPYIFCDIVRYIVSREVEASLWLSYFVVDLTDILNNAVSLVSAF